MKSLRIINKFTNLLTQWLHPSRLYLCLYCDRLVVVCKEIIITVLIKQLRLTVEAFLRELLVEVNEGYFHWLLQAWM